MKDIYLNYLTQRKDAKKLSYDVLEERTHISKSKLQRIFTGQIDVTISDLETIVEKGFCENTEVLYAQMGKQEFADSQDVDYKGARELLKNFADEKAQIRSEYEMRIGQSIKAREDTQQAFSSALATLGDQYRKNADYLTTIIKDNEAYIRDLLSQTERAEAIAAAAQKRAEEAEKTREDIEKRRHHVFLGMLFIVVVLLAALLFIIIADVPQIGGGNL